MNEDANIPSAAHRSKTPRLGSKNIELNGMLFEMSYLERRDGFKKPVVVHTVSPVLSSA